MAKQDMTGRETSGKPSAGTGPERALTPFEEMERIFGSMFPRHHMRPHDWEWPSFAELTAMADSKLPRLDIIERDEEVLVRAELPGVDKKDLDITVTDKTVSIKGSTKQESRQEEGEYVRSEIRQGSFSRAAALPCHVDGNKARAKFEDGMLSLTIPKVQGTRRHSIEVE